MKKGKRYLIQRMHSRHLQEVKCLEISETSYKLKWESGGTTWEDKSCFSKNALYSNEYRIIEELS